MSSDPSDRGAPDGAERESAGQTASDRGAPKGAERESAGQTASDRGAPKGAERESAGQTASGRGAPDGAERESAGQTMPQRRGVCLVVAAPSGAGKSSVARALLESEPALTLSVSATTRAARPGEREGVHYFFRSEPAFLAMVEAGAMLEHAAIFGRRYGTPRAPVEAALAAGRDVLFDIDWQGHRQLREKLPGDVIGLFLLPPSLAELERRLAGRGQDSEAEVARRMAAARDEIAHWDEFDHVLVNEDFALTVAAARAVLHAGRSAAARQPGLRDFVARLTG
jgi:guanylate kinase